MDQFRNNTTGMYLKLNSFFKVFQIFDLILNNPLHKQQICSMTLITISKTMETLLNPFPSAEAF